MSKTTEGAETIFVFSSNGVQLLIDSKLSSIDQYTECCIANNVVWTSNTHGVASKKEAFKKIEIEKESY